MESTVPVTPITERHTFSCVHFDFGLSQIDKLRWFISFFLFALPWKQSNFADNNENKHEGFEERTRNLE